MPLCLMGHISRTTRRMTECVDRESDMATYGSMHPNQVNVSTDPNPPAATGRLHISVPISNVLSAEHVSAKRPGEHE